MRWREALTPVTMQRVALLAPTASVRDVLVQIADTAALEFDEPPDYETQAGRQELLTREAELQRRAATGLQHGSVTGFVGWARGDHVEQVEAAIADAGGALLRLGRPAHVQPPTLLVENDPGRSFAPLVETYATVPYRDVDPAVMAGIAFVVMFGMMFADAGHGMLLLAAALAVRFGRWPKLRRWQPVWPFLAGGGIASIVFGALYGEFFGPTNVIPVSWLDPTEQLVPVLAAAIGVGAVFLTGSYVLGTINRVREGGWRVALYAPSGLAGAALFGGVGLLAAGLYFHQLWLVAVGAAGCAVALALVFTGTFAESGGGGAGGAEAGIEVFDLVLRVGSNIVSFVRLGAFGVTHAVLGAVVCSAAAAAWRHDGLGVVLAVVVFVVGNAVTFALEALVAGVQALRLEYYELFSRVFVGEGRPFRPWQLPVEHDAGVEHVEAPCRAG